MPKAAKPAPDVRTRMLKRKAARTLDLFKLHKAELKMPRKPELVDVGAGTYLAVHGKGEPGGEEFQAAIGALYAMAWTIKMTRKFGGRDDFRVCALEGIYRERCDWTLMIRVPAFVTKAQVKKAAAEQVRKGKPAVEGVELMRMKEGRCAQVLQVGPYDTVCRTVEELQAYGAAQGLVCRGPLHEIYLNDPRRVAPEKIRTLVRRPVGKA